jgi:hypothetical protein
MPIRSACGLRPAIRDKFLSLLPKQLKSPFEAERESYLSKSGGSFIWAMRALTPSPAMGCGIIAAR